MTNNMEVKKIISNFKKTKGRAPKVLHMGNIANNAYQNAKIMRSVGVECDVLSCDYYHIMSCPEWADADFSGDYVNSYFPQWSKVDLKGFKRPKWFLAGPARLCFEYLYEKNRKHYLRSRINYGLLQWAYNDITKNADANQYWLADVWKPFRPLRAKLIKLVRRIPKRQRKILRSWYVSFVDCKRKFTYKKGIKNNVYDTYEIIRNKVINDFKVLFPDREAEFKDIDGYISSAIFMKKVFDQYDYIVLYATNPIFAYLLDCENYIAYEHGTIRDLPYQDNDMGRLLLLSYAKAKAIYLTNVDNLESAKYITQNIDTQIVCGLHGIDIDGILKKSERIKRRSEFDGRFNIDESITIFFCPSRHDWDGERNGFIKGEDLMIRAAGQMMDEGMDFRIVFIDWGNDVRKIKSFIRNYEKLEQRIIWSAPLGQDELFRVYQSVDAVIDQFCLHAYGSIAFEVLAVSHAALITCAVDKDRQRLFYGDILPYFACETQEDIKSAMRSVVFKDDSYREKVSTSRDWMYAHHSNKQILNKLMEAIEL